MKEFGRLVPRGLGWCKRIFSKYLGRARHGDLHKKDGAKILILGGPRSAENDDLWESTKNVSRGDFQYKCSPA